MPIAVDFETYYAKDYSVADLGVWGYASHPKFDAYLVAVVGEGIRYIGHPSGFDWCLLSGKELVSHNAAFDAFIFARLVLLGVIPDDVKPAAWHCSANLAAFLGAPRNLAGAAKELLGLALSKDLRVWMKGRTWADALAAGKADALKDYALRDAEASLAIWDKYAALWPEEEQELARLTTTMGWRGICVDGERVQSGIQTLERVMFEAAAKIPWADGDAAILSPKALGEHCRFAGIPPPPSLSEDDPACEAWERTYGEKFPWVAAMRDWRKANALCEKLKTMRARTRGTDGCMGYGLKYFGAHTGRWSGDAGFNIQNLPRGESYGVDIRACIIPRPGKQFIVCDLAQIEPRVMAWLSGDVALLAHLAVNVPLYEAHARGTMGWTGGNLKKENPRLYSLAKARVLGLGYGCGSEKFVAVAKNLGGIDISLEEAKETVRAFRSSNRCITGLWNRLQSDFRWSVGKDHEIELPSGRVLTYRNVRSNGGWTAQTERGGPRQAFYGGRLCENLVQAVARDVFAQALLRLERAGVPVVFHVHDEAVCETSVDTPAQEIARIMSATPPWLPGCSLAAEASVATRYLK